MALTRKKKKEATIKTSKKKRLVFDIESNGLLDTMDCIHLLCIQDLDTGIKWTWRNCEKAVGNHHIKAGLEFLDTADVIIGHNIIGFDIPAIKLIFPDWEPQGDLYDTFVSASVIYPHIKEIDFRKRLRNMPLKHYGSHSLKAWGLRLGIHKGDFSEETDWAEWSQDMEDYCVQDVEVNVALMKFLESKPYSSDCIQLEHRFKEMMVMQELNGVGFDEESAGQLYAEIEGRRLDLVDELVNHYPPFEKEMKSCYWNSPDGKEWRTKKEAKSKGGWKSDELTKGRHVIKYVPLNPTSTAQIAKVLQKYQGWKPKEFTSTGLPQVTETILSALPYPEAAKFKTLLMLQKRVSQLSTGKEGWLRHVKDGKIHGRVKTNHAVTGRCSHSQPNLAQVPSVQLDKDDNILYGFDGGYGYEMRDLFRPTRKGWDQVGADASGLELRCLAHYLGKWDDGEYGRQIIEGDIHTYNQKAAGLPTRSNAKTFIYGWLYGAGDEKIGEIVGGSAHHGKKLKEKFMAALPAVRSLKQGVATAIKRRGYLTGLDGRKLYIRSEHSALNMLLQSAGAVVMKTAAVIFYELASEAGVYHGDDYALMLNVHDEFQIECKPELSIQLGELMVQAIIDAGEVYDFRCPLDGEYKIGSSWAGTH